MTRIALIVGHEVYGKAQGAVNYKGETESAFNHRICKKLLARMEQGNLVHGKIFMRDNIGVKGVAKQVAEFAPDLSIEFHFNSFSKVAKGCEALAIKGDEKSIVFADLITDVMKKNLGLSERNGNGVLLVSKGANGYWNLKYIEDAYKTAIPKIIVEPVFANFKTEESQRIFEHEDDYVEAVYESILSYFKLEEKHEVKQVHEIETVEADKNSPLTSMLNLIKGWSSY